MAMTQREKLQKMRAASPWRLDRAIPPDRAIGSSLPQTRFTTSHRAVLRFHRLEPSTCVVYDAQGTPIAAMDKITRLRTAL